MSHCSVDSRSSCTRVHVVVVATNSSNSVASSCPPAPPRPSTHRQLSSRCLNSRSPFGHLKPTSLANLFVRNLYPVTHVLRHMRPLLLTSTRSGTRLFLLPDDVQLSVGLVIGCPIISGLDDRHVPTICHVALQALNSCTTPEDVHASLRSPSQGSFRQPTWRPSCIACMHQFFDSSGACSATCCSSAQAHSSFDSFVATSSSRSVLPGSFPSGGIHNHL